MPHLTIGYAAVLNERDEILLLRRSKTAPARALDWDLPGGTVELDENPEIGTIRELLEETGIVATFSKFIFKTTVPSLNGYKDFYFFNVNSDSNNVALSYEHDKYMWIPQADCLMYLKYPPMREAFEFIWHNPYSIGA